MDFIGILIEFWWVALLLIPAYLIYRRTKNGQGVWSFGYDETKLIFVFILTLIVIYVCQRFFFDHWFLLFYLIIFIPLFSAFIYILLLGNNVLIIESTMDCEIFYDIGMLDKRIAESTRTRAFMIDRDAYREIRHVGDIEYQYWNGGDGVKFTDYFDQKEGVMYHPSISALHNVSFFIAKSFWLRMKEDLPELMRKNAMLTWLQDYQVAYNQSILAKNFKLRLKGIARQYEDDPFSLPGDIRKLWEHEVEARRRDRETQETREPIPEESSASNALNAPNASNASKTSSANGPTGASGKDGGTK